MQLGLPGYSACPRDGVGQHEDSGVPHAFDDDALIRSHLKGRISEMLVLGLMVLAGRQNTISEVVIAQHARENENA